MKRTLLVILLLIATHCALAQWHHFVANYSRAEYGQGSQTWCIAPVGGDFVYFANMNGVLQFSRAGWETFNIDSEVRSVMVSTSKSRLYVGGINEIGYYEPDQSGCMRYKSISDSMPDAERDAIGNVWNIHEIDNSQYFAADGEIIKYTSDGDFKIVKSPSQILSSAATGGVLYVATETGFYFLSGDRLRLCQNTEILSDKQVRGLVPFKDGIIAITMEHGAYYYDGTLCSQFKTDADQFLYENIAFCAADGDSIFAVGTIKGGVAVIDKNTRKSVYFDDHNGLQNNTVLSLAFEDRGNLWVGLDNGIDKILLTYPIKNLYSQQLFYGAGYDALVCGNQLYLATNRGLFATSWPNVGEVKEIEGGVGQTWKLRAFDGEIFCLHDHGLFAIRDGKLHTISKIPGFWGMTQIVDSHDIIAGTYGTLWLIRRTADDNYDIRELKGVKGSFSNMATTKDGTIWLKDHNKATVYQAVMDGDSLRVIKVYNKDNGLPDDKFLKIYTEDHRRVIAMSEKGIFQYDNDRFNATTEIGGLAMAQDKRHTVYYQQHGIMVSCSEGKSKIVGFGQHVIDPQQPVADPVIIGDSVCIIPNLNGFATIDLCFVSDTTPRFQHLINCALILSQGGDSTIYAANFANIMSTPTVNYHYNDIRIEYGSGSSNYTYRYRLGDEPWSTPTKTASREFTNLPEGNYTFHVEELAGSRIIAADSFTFIILPPWYRTVWAYIFYAILAAIAIYALNKAEKRKINIEKKKVEDAKNLDIMALEKEKLENELAHKTQELANMMASVAGKNEILNELKKDIADISAAEKSITLSLKRRLSDLNTKIDSNISTDNIFDKFEEQFNLLHNNFIKTLKSRYPDLSRNELMLCAYTIMELSTKEIAQLLNISVRGVETMRYRLKKKIIDDKNVDFGEFLKGMAK